jgi:hypothetical protein
MAHLLESPMTCRAVSKHGPTIADQKREQRDSLFRQVRQNADVQAVLASFPGAEIVEVRDLASQQPSTQPDGGQEAEAHIEPDDMVMDD